MRPFSNTSSKMIFMQHFSARSPYLMYTVPFVASSSLLKMLELRLGPPQASLSTTSFRMG